MVSKGVFSKVGRGLSLCLILAFPLMGADCDSKPVELSLFHTNDVHSHLRSAKSDPFGLGGLAKLSTLLKSLRKKAQVSLTLDAGDWSEGTWYYSLDTGANMLRFMDALKYDAVCLGNHDFLNGPDRLISTVNEARASFPVLAANLDSTLYSSPTDFQKAVPATVIKTVGGIKVGIIGLTTYEPFYASYMKPVKILNPIDSATAAAKMLRPNVDVLLVVSHNAFETNVEIARAVPGLDAVISGHTHKKVPHAVLVSNAGRSVPVVETGAWAKFLGDLKLNVTPGKKVVEFKSYELHPVTPDLAEDSAIVSMIDAEDAKMDEKFGPQVGPVAQVVAHADHDLYQEDAKESGLGNLAVKAYRAETGADLSLEEISFTGVSLAKGPVSIMDLHDVVPHIFDFKTQKEWELKVWNAKGSDLSLVFNVFYTVSGLMPLSSPLGWLSADNVDLVWKPGTSFKDIPAVKKIRIGGKPLDPNARYTVALHDGLLSALSQAQAMLGLGLDLSQVTGTGVEAWRAVVNYAASVKTLDVATLGIGGHSRVESADLAVYHYGVELTADGLSIDVVNQGLKTSTTGMLTCFKGIPNDLLSFDTDSQVWTKIGETPIAPLDIDAGVTLTVRFDRAPIAGAGFVPVKCDVTVSGDVYDPNNHVMKVFRAQ